MRGRQSSGWRTKSDGKTGTGDNGYETGNERNELEDVRNKIRNIRDVRNEIRNIRDVRNEIRNR